jgi:hypothetical protein
MVTDFRAAPALLVSALFPPRSFVFPSAGIDHCQPLL